MTPPERPPSLWRIYVAAGMAKVVRLFGARQIAAECDELVRSARAWREIERRHRP